MHSFTNILLVYPEVPKITYWSFHYSLSIVGKKSAMPPLGMLTLAALLPDRCRLKLVDMNVTALTDSDLMWADAVMVSAMIVQKESFRGVVAACRRIGRPVVAGGPYPSACPEEMTGVDHVLRGEVEESFSAFFEAFEQGTAPKVVDRADRPDLSDSPLPRFDLLALDAYTSMAIQYSRGCPFKCEFCDIWQMYGNRPRVKPVQRILAELDALHRLGWRQAVFVVDDNFIGNRKRVKSELLPALIQWQHQHGRPFQLFTEASIDLARDDDLIAAMVAAGFNEVFIGIETPSAAALQETGKHQNLKVDLLEAVTRVQRGGMEVTAGFILGFDSDTTDIFDRQIEFIQRAGIPKAMVGILTALPETALYRRLSAQGRLTGDSPGNNTHQMSTNFITRMPAAQLKAGYRKILAALYDPRMRNYFARCDILLDRLENTARFQRLIGWKEIIILLRSVIRQSLTVYGFDYLRFLLRNLAKHRDVFGEAVRMAIQGHHFHTITRERLKVEALDLEMEQVYAYFSARLDACRQSVRSSSQGTLLQLKDLADQCSRILRRIQRRANGIHADFQDELAQRCRQWTEAVDALFDG
jgi:radical SAM superfamily enzyme YgiQ (UPF0313 family)